MRSWSLYERRSEDSIMLLAEWMELVKIPLFRSRLHPDFLARVPEYRAEFVTTIHGMGKTSPFWQVG